MRLAYDVFLGLVIILGVAAHWSNYQESKLTKSELNWQIGSYLKCEFDVLLDGPNSQLVVDKADFDCKVVAFERAEVVNMPHYTLDCSKSHTNKFLDLKYPVTIVYSYLHEPENCYYP